jgi:hypothetical protein
VKVNRQLPSLRRLATGLALGIAALLAATATAQIRGGFKGSGSKYPEYYPIMPGTGTQTNRLRGLFFGQDWQHLSNKVFRVNGMRIEHYELTGGTNLVAVAPECLFDAEARVAWSTGRLEIVGQDGAVTLQGSRGFFTRMADSTLTISNRVKTAIRRDLAGSFAP